MLRFLLELSQHLIKMAKKMQSALLKLTDCSMIGKICTDIAFASSLLVSCARSRLLIQLTR